MKAGISKLIFFLWFLFSAVHVTAEINNTGIPAIQNFTRKTYKASTQNWGVAQSTNGFMYFANNDGLIEYDGIYWKLYQFAEPALTRSVATDKSGNIYVGMYNEFGVAQIDEYGVLIYNSFRKLLPDSIKDIGDVWKIHVTDKGIFFQTQNHLMWFDSTGKLIKPFFSEGNYRYSFTQNNRLFIHETGNGLLELTGNELLLLPGTESLSGFEVWSVIIGENEKLIIGTARNGVFVYNKGALHAWTSAVNTILKSKQIFSCCRLFDTSIAIGTVQDGVFVVSENGELIQHFNKLNGLQNNTILSMSTDKDGNLWLGLDNGIDYIEINSPVSFLYHNEGFGAGYSVAIHKGFLYLGTNNGLFATPWPKKTIGNRDDFFFIHATVGQVWHLGVYDDILLCGHDNGTFLIDGLNANKISDIKGVWKFLKLKEYPDFLIGGTYEGLILFEKNNRDKKWQFKTKVKGFTESSRVMEEDEDGSIWMTHGFKGVFKIILNINLDSVIHSSYFGVKSGFITSNYINVYKINKKPVFTTREGIFIYNRKTNRFEKDLKLEKLFATTDHISYIKQDENQNIWYVAGGKPGLLKHNDIQTYTTEKNTFEILHNQMVAGFESIYFTNNNEVVFCLVNGFAIYLPSLQKTKNESFYTFIRSVEIFNENKIFHGGKNSLEITQKKIVKPEIKYPRNRIRFQFTTPRFHGQRDLEFSYLLNNYSDDWSEWSSTPICEFANLLEGNYIFKVKARDPNGNISEPDLFSFTIKPPWYRSFLAYFFYFTLALAIIFLFIWFLLKRIEVSKRKERLKHLKEYRLKEQQYQREVLMAEREIIKLRNEKLQVEMIHRDKELANQTLSLIQKNEFLLNLKDELRKLTLNIKEDSVAFKMVHLMNRIDKDIDNKKHMALFESAFDEVHEDFMKKLKVKYPDLSVKDLRLCAYLRMNLSTKELATLSNISERGVEISRYRLRKKLKLDRDINLTGFMTDV